MAALEIFHRMGSECSGLIRFSAICPHYPEWHALKLAQSGDWVQVNIGHYHPGSSFPLFDYDRGLWLPCGEARRVCELALQVLPGRERAAADLLERQEVRR